MSVGMIIKIKKKTIYLQAKSVKRKTISKYNTRVHPEIIYHKKVSNSPHYYAVQRNLSNNYDLEVKYSVELFNPDHIFTICILKIFCS